MASRAAASLAVVAVSQLSVALAQTTQEDEGSSPNILLWGIVGGILGLVALFGIALCVLVVWMKHKERKLKRRATSRSSADGLLGSRDRNHSMLSSISAGADAGTPWTDRAQSTETTMTSLESGLSSLATAGSEVLLQRARLQQPPAPNIVLTFRQSPATALKSTMPPALRQNGKGGMSNYGLTDDTSAFAPHLASAMANADTDRGSEEMEMIWPAPSMSTLAETSRECSRDSTLHKPSAASTLSKPSAGFSSLHKSAAPSSLLRTPDTPDERSEDLDASDTPKSTSTDGNVRASVAGAVSADTGHDITHQARAGDDLTGRAMVSGVSKEEHTSSPGHEPGSDPEYPDSHDVAAGHLEDLQRALNQEMASDDSDLATSHDDDVTDQDDTMTTQLTGTAHSAYMENNGQRHAELAMASQATGEQSDAVASHTLESNQSTETADSAYDENPAEETGISFGLDVELWEASEPQDEPEQEEIWDAIHGFYDHSAHQLRASTMMSDRSNVDEDLEQLNMSIDTLQTLRRLEAKERKAAKNVNRRSQPIVHTHDVPSILDIFPAREEMAPPDIQEVPSQDEADDAPPKPQIASTPVPVAGVAANENSLSRTVDNAEKDFLEAPVFGTPRIAEVPDTSDAAQGGGNSLFVNPMYTPILQT